MTCLYMFAPRQHPRWPFCNGRFRDCSVHVHCSPSVLVPTWLRTDAARCWIALTRYDFHAMCRPLVLDCSCKLISQNFRHEWDDCIPAHSKATCNTSVLPFLQPDVVIELMPALRSKGWFHESRGTDGTEHQHITGVWIMLTLYRSVQYDIVAWSQSWWLPAALSDTQKSESLWTKTAPTQSFQAPKPTE